MGKRRGEKRKGLRKRRKVKLDEGGSRGERKVEGGEAEGVMRRRRRSIL